MTPLTSLTVGPLSYRIGWTLVHSLWQAALVGLVLGGMLLLLRRRSANARYLAGCVALLTTIVLAAVTFFIISPADPAAVPAFGRFSVPTAGPGVEYSLPASALVPEPAKLNATYRPAMSVPWRVRALSLLESHFSWIVAGWLIGVSVLSLRILGSWLKAQGLRHLQVEPPPAGWRNNLLRLAHQLGIHRRLELLQSRLARVPTVVGHVKPVILLPAAAVTGLTPEQIEAILAHELAHIRRHDYLVNLFQVLVETVMFYHPAAWWISHRIRIERENCCDDLAIGLCGDRFGYIRALVTLEEFRDVPAPALAVAWQGGSLLDRVRRLLGVPAPQTLQSARWMAGPATLVVFLAVMAGVFAPSFAMQARHARTLVASAASAPANRSADSFSDKVAQLDINNARLDDVTRIFGEPKSYSWGNEQTGESKTYTRDDLPAYYVMVYPDGFRILMGNGRIEEIRFEEGSTYLWRGGLHVGSSLNDVLNVLGQPAKTVTGEPLTFEDGVLYQDAGGRKGLSYYARPDQGVRMFFRDDKVAALYVTRTQPPVEAAGFAATLQAKVPQLDITNAGLADIVALFGEPTAYVWGNEQSGEVKTFKKDDLPPYYIMDYPARFSIFMVEGRIQELRFEQGSAYVWRGGLHVGSSLDDALNVVGQPTRTVTGEELTFQDGVLYKDCNRGRMKGFGYYSRQERGVRMFFMGNKVLALYLTRTQPSAQAKAFYADLQAQVDSLDINQAGREDIIRTFGKPLSYIWGDKTFTEDDLPDQYIMRYPGNVSVMMSSGRIEELRFEGYESADVPTYAYEGKLRVHSTMEEQGNRMFKETGREFGCR